jgi:monofunctional biosynthetic peptidoglycan transglycosylase
MKKIKIIALTSVLYFFVFTIQVVVIHKYVNPLITPLMIERVLEGLFTGAPAGIHKRWVSMEEISPNMVRAVMASEDQKFLEHNGFDWEAINKALKYNKKKKGKKVHGASTISQQTAKNVFLWPSRMWVRKGFEVYFTFLIEAIWSKERIMEVYLNVIEMGDGIYGVEAASRKYFKTSALKISVTQAASIAAILPLPLKWSPLKPNNRVVARISWIRHQMGYIETPEWAEKTSR